MGIANGLVGVEIDLFVFEAPPQPLDEDIVSPASCPIPVDLNPVGSQEPGELLVGELTTLIRVEDL